MKTTGHDGDGAMQIDTRAGTLFIQDDARGPHGPYSLTARIDQTL